MHLQSHIFFCCCNVFLVFINFLQTPHCKMHPQKMGEHHRHKAVQPTPACTQSTSRVKGSKILFGKAISFLRLLSWGVVMAPPHGTPQISTVTMQAEHPTPPAVSVCEGPVRLMILLFLFIGLGLSHGHTFCISLHLLLKSEVTNATMAISGHRQLYIL